MTSHDDTSPRSAGLTADLVVEGFAGPGGWSEGLRLAGHRGAAVGLEHDMTACRTAVAAGHARICADVATYPTAPFEGRVDGLIQSPPCQGWSNAGDRKGELDRAAVHDRLVAFAHGREPAVAQWHDERSPLAAEPMRWAYALRPRWIALEQVPPVLPLWEHMAILLRGMGYRVWTGMLSAEEYGVPQTRKRAILMARRDGQPVGPPTPTHQPYRSGVAYETESSLFGDPPPQPVSMADALGWGLPDQPSSVVMTARGRLAGPEDALRGSSWRHAWFQRQIAAGNWVMRSNYGTGGDSADRGERGATEPAPTITSKVNRNKVVFRNGPQDNATDRNMDDPAGPECGEARTDEQSVRVTVQEAGVLQSFPADYPWTGTKSQQYRCVGDAVPPLLAMHILKQFLLRPSGHGAAT